MTRTRRLIALLVGIAVATAAAAEAVRAANDRPAYRAIWKIIDTQRRNQATAVAVSPTRALTNAHVLYEFVRQKSTDLVLTDSRGQRIVHIVGPVAVSATYDLALIETAEPMPRYLRIARGLPRGRAEQFHLAGYPKQRFATLHATQEITASTRASFRLPMERIILGGFSGGPVLAPNDEIVGIHKTSTRNIAGVIPATTVHEFLTGAIGVRCRSRALEPCLEKASRRTRALAAQGFSDAQYQLGRKGRSGRYIPGDRDLGLLEKSARQGNPDAQAELCGCVRRGRSRARQGPEEGGVLVGESGPAGIRGTATQHRHPLLQRRWRGQGPGDIERVARPSGEERTSRCRVRPGLCLPVWRGSAPGPGARPLLVSPGRETGPRGGGQGARRDGRAAEQLRQQCPARTVMDSADSARVGVGPYRRSGSAGAQANPAPNATRGPVAPPIVSPLKIFVSGLVTGSAFSASPLAAWARSAIRRDARTTGNANGPSQSAARSKMTTAPALWPGHKVATVLRPGRIRRTWCMSMRLSAAASMARSFLRVSKERCRWTAGPAGQVGRSADARGILGPCQART